MTFGVSANTAVAQVIPPAAGTASPAQTPFPLRAPAAGTNWATSLPPANRCGDPHAAIAVSGNLGRPLGRDTFGMAGIIESDSGGYLADYLRRGMAAQQRMADIGTDREKMTLEIDRQLAGAEEKAKSYASYDAMRASLERQKAESDALPKALSSARVMVLSSAGAFRCPGISPGRYDVFVFLMHRETVTRASAEIGTNVLRMTVLSSFVEVPVPPRGERIEVKVGAFRVVGDVDPNR